MNGKVKVDLLELATRLKADSEGKLREELRGRIDLLEKRANAYFRQSLSAQEAARLKALLRAVETSRRILEKACIQSKIQVQPDGRVVME